MTFPRRFVRLLVLPILLLSVGGLSLADEYRIGRGDTVSIAVVGYPDLTRKALVTTAGEISLPFVGTVAVAGKTLDEVRTNLKQILAEKGVVRGAELTLEIAEYAPIYVNGDVTKPGAYPYRPSMTVRHAVALASGYSTRPEGLSAADLWGQHRTAALVAMKAQARVIRLQAELAGADKVEFDTLNVAPSDRSLAERITDLEVEQFNARKQDRKREVTYLKDMIKLVQDQKRSLQTQQETEKGNVQALATDYERVRKAFSRGVVPASRLTEALQAVGQAKARSSTNLSQIVEMSRLETDFERKAQRFEDAERLKILAELQDAVIEAESANARLRVAREKLDKGGARGQFGNYLEVEIRIFRSDGKGIPADEGTALQSGDVVEIRMPYDDQQSAIRSRNGRAANPN